MVAVSVSVRPQSCGTAFLIAERGTIQLTCRGRAASRGYRPPPLTVTTLMRMSDATSRDPQTSVCIATDWALAVRRPCRTPSKIFSVVPLMSLDWSWPASTIDAIWLSSLCTISLRTPNFLRADALSRQCQPLAPRGALKNADQPDAVSVGSQKAFRSSFANDVASLPWLHCGRGLRSR
jgi:hypothetical protein